MRLVVVIDGANPEYPVVARFETGMPLLLLHPSMAETQMLTAIRAASTEVEHGQD